MTSRNDLKEILSEGIHNVRFADSWSEAVDYTWEQVAAYVARDAHAGIEYHVVGTNISYRQLVDIIESDGDFSQGLPRVDRTGTSQGP
jgi:hypothetical protein